MARTAEQKARAAEYVLRAMLDLGWNRDRFRRETGLDAGTVRTFLAGETFPQAPKRAAIESAMGFQPGTLELAADGIVRWGEAEEGDEVEAAINRSALSRANKAKLIGTYYEMLDAGQERGAS